MRTDAGVRPAGAGTGHVSPVLELVGITKRFPGVIALSDVTLTCFPGEIHALVGENGSGKSTLIKIASGAVAPDQGKVRIRGSALGSASPLAARTLGLLTAYQDTSLVEELTVAQNVLLSYHGTRDRGFALDFEEATRLLEPFDLPFEGNDRVAELGPGARQLLEVVKALVHDPPVLLLDEPTAALDSDSIGDLESLLQTAVQRGSAVLYITHRLDEIERIAHRVSVLRDGVLQGQFEGRGWNTAEVVDLMIGLPTDLAFPPKRQPRAEDRVVFSVEGFRGTKFGPVDLAVREGEIVGIAGAEGNGQRELLRSVIGLQPARGAVSVGERAVDVRSPRAALAAGITFQSGDRIAESVFADLSTLTNATMSLGPELGPAGLVMRAREVERFRPMAASVNLVAASIDQPVRQLSGGNQQKTALARSLMSSTKVLVVDEPTQGVDAKARLDIYRILRAEAAAGAAVLVSSSDSAELGGLCDRVYVLSRGRIVEELTDDDVREDRIVEAFVGRRGEAFGAGQAPHDKPRRRRARIFATRSQWTPLLYLAAIIVGLGAYAQVKSTTFLTQSNMNSLFITALPLAIVALGEQCLLLTGGFDISVGSTMSLTVVVASFVATSSSAPGALPGLLVCLAVGIGVGLVNGFIVLVLEVNAIIATIATLGVVSGLAILLRGAPGGTISPGLTGALDHQVGFLPVAFLIVVVLAVIGELWRVRASGGLSVQAVGLRPEAARRSGIRVDLVTFCGYVVCGLCAAIAGVFLSVQVGSGSNAVGQGYALTAFTACFVGGASLAGGRGSFVGTVLGAVFLAMLTNITPLVNIPDATAQIATGAITVVAVLAYSVRRGPTTSRRSTAIGVGVESATAAGEG